MKLTFQKATTGEFLLVKARNCSNESSIQEVTFSENQYEITLGSKELERKIKSVYELGHTMIVDKHYKTAKGCINAIIKKLKLKHT